MSRAPGDGIDQLLSRVEVPSPWDVEQLCESVSRVIDRPVRLMTRTPTETDRIYANVLARPDVYYLFVRDDLRGLHRDQAICHELGHLLAGHLDALEEAPVPPNIAALLPTLSPAMIARFLNRDCCYDVDREREAELIGSALLRRGRDESAASRSHVARGFGEALL